MKKAEPHRAWQIRVDLQSTWPPVWRRILVPGRINLLDLHEVIQAAFGWEGYHLHEFTIHGAQYGDPANDEFGDLDLQDETETKLRNLGLSEGESFTYIYDFGDDWQHTLLVEKTVPVENRKKLPLCLDGRRACPPEDVGGVHGYAEFLEALADPGHPEHTRYLEWVGGAFDPEAFDPQAANERLAAHARAKRSPVWGLQPDGERCAVVPLFDPSVFETPATAEHEMTARDLPLRRDVQSLVTYIRDHKVNGTQSTGNLPLKAVAEVSSAFVHPPALETSIGDKVFRFRSEQEVWPVFFAHILAHKADLISGGPGRRWRLTPRGEQFLSAPAAVQVWVLLNAWWYRVNWLIAVPFNIFSETLPAQVQQTTLPLLRGLRIGQPVEFEPFFDRLIEELGWTWTRQEPDHTGRFIRSAVKRMLIDPLAELGVLSTERVKDPESFFDLLELTAFSLTDFGRMLLDALR